MSYLSMMGYCFVAFGLGYAGGSTIRVVRKAIEALD